MELLLITRDTCIPCDVIKDLMNKHNIKYNVLDFKDLNNSGLDIMFIKYIESLRVTPIVIFKNDNSIFETIKATEININTILNSCKFFGIEHKQ